MAEVIFRLICTFSRLPHAVWVALRVWLHCELNSRVSTTFLAAVSLSYSRVSTTNEPLSDYVIDNFSYLPITRFLYMTQYSVNIDLVYFYQQACLKDKKVIIALSSRQEESDQYSTDKASVVKQRRRDMHKQLSYDKREALLLQRQTRYRESYNQNLLNRFHAPANNDKSRLSYPQIQVTGQRGVTITEIPPHPQIGLLDIIDNPKMICFWLSVIIICLC